MSGHKTVNRNRHTDDSPFELIDREVTIMMINMKKDLVEKMGNVHEERGKFSRQMETIKQI